MKKFAVLLLVFLNLSCTNKFVVTFEQPTDVKLNNLKLEVFLDNEKLEDINLKNSDIIPSYTSTKLAASGEGKHHLMIKVKDTVFNYDIDYPKEKYILVSSYLKKNGKVHIGIVKKEREFTLN